MDSTLSPDVQTLRRASWIGPESVLVCYRVGDATGLAVAQYYAQVRNIPAENVIPLFMTWTPQVNGAYITWQDMDDVMDQLRPHYKPPIRAILTCGWFPQYVSGFSAAPRFSYQLSDLIAMYDSYPEGSQDAAYRHSLSPGVRAYAWNFKDNYPESLQYDVKIAYACATTQCGFSKKYKPPYFAVPPVDHLTRWGAQPIPHFRLEVAPVEATDDRISDPTEFGYIKRMIDDGIAAEQAQYQDFGTVVLTGSGSYCSDNYGENSCLSTALPLWEEFKNNSIPANNIYAADMVSEGYRVKRNQSMSSGQYGFWFALDYGGQYYWIELVGRNEALTVQGDQIWMWNGPPLLDGNGDPLLDENGNTYPTEGDPVLDGNGNPTYYWYMAPIVTGANHPTWDFSQLGATTMDGTALFAYRGVRDIANRFPNGATALAPGMSGKTFVPLTDVFYRSSGVSSYFSIAATVEDASHFQYRKGALAYFSQSFSDTPSLLYAIELDYGLRVPIFYTTPKNANPALSNYNGVVLFTNKLGRDSVGFDVTYTGGAGTTATIRFSVGGSLILNQGGSDILTIDMSTAKTIRQHLTAVQSVLPANWTASIKDGHSGMSRSQTATRYGSVGYYGCVTEPYANNGVTTPQLPTNLWSGMNMAECMFTMLDHVDLHEYSIIVGDPLYRPFGHRRESAMTTTIHKDQFAEPIHIDEARLHLRSDGNTDDTLIKGLISAARSSAETKTQRQLVTVTAEQTFGVFSDRMLLSLPQVRKIVSVKYFDSAGIEQVLDPSTYRVNTNKEPCYIDLAVGASWPATSDMYDAITIKYTAGYATPFTVNAGTDTLMAKGHPYANGDEVFLSNSGGALPAGLSVDTQYYAVGVNGDYLQLSLTQGGAAVDITGAGTGTHFLGIIPESVISWMLMTIGSLYNQREGVNVGNIVTEMPFMEGLLDEHRVIRVA